MNFREANGDQMIIATGGAISMISALSVNTNTNTQTIGSDGTYGSTYPMYSFTGTTNGSHRIFAGTADDMYFAAATSRGFRFRPNGGTSDLVVINSSGNVGIGTTAPGAKLQIVGGSTDTVGQIRVGGTDATYVSGIDFYTSTTARGFVGWRGINSGSPYNSYGMYLVNYDNSPIIFGTSTGNEKMRITDGGNVGIGTSSPTSKLTVNDTGDIAYLTINTTATTNRRTRLQFTKGSNAGMELGTDYGMNDSSDFYFYNRVTSATYMVIGTNSYFTGNLGIGTTAPINLLHVNGTGNSSGILARFSSTSTSGSITIAHSGNGGSIGYANIGAGDASNTFYITTGAGTIGSGIVMNNGGNVGIGTTTPSQKLEVAGIIRGEALNPYGSTDPASTSPYLYSPSLAALGIGMNGSEKIRINSSGNVGIGTTSPSFKLHVSGQTYMNNGTSNALYIETTVADGNTRDGIYLFEDDGQASGRQAISWYNGNQSYYKARIWTEVGSSYAATQFGIDVANNARTVATRLYINNGDTYHSGDVIAYASDERLKENITPITNALDKIQKISGVHYDWKDKVKDLGFEPTNKHDVGVIAQSVQSVLPEAVKPAPFDYIGGSSKSGENYLTVQYEKIVPLLIESIKELKSQNDTLQSRIEQLENK
jgi:hypothetical protein